MSRHQSSLPALCAAGVFLLFLWALTAAVPAAVQVQPAPAPIEISGAAYLEYEEATGLLRAEGTPVVVTRGRTVLRAPRIRYDQRARVIAGEGGVEITEPDLSMRADAADLRLTDDRVRARGDVRMRGMSGGQPMTLAAPEVDGFLRARRFVATGGVSVTRGEWALTGRRVDYEDATRVAVVSGEPMARLKDATMTAQVITLFVADEIARAEGSVRVRRGDLVGTAPRADIFGRDGRAVLSGGARVDRGPDKVVADVIEIDLDGNRVTARGTSKLTIVPAASPTP